MYIFIYLGHTIICMFIRKKYRLFTLYATISLLTKIQYKIYYYTM